jgi:hypothetical protein
MMHILQKKYFAEVIESSLSNWKAHVWQWNNFPKFGSLVTIETKERILFGIIHQVHTGSSDPNRTPFPYQKTYTELLQEQPHIFEFLQTICTCLIVGYQENNKIFYHIAPQPPPIHAFMAYATTEQITDFFQNDLYLHLLFSFNSPFIPLDELLLVQLEQLATLKILTRNRFFAFIELFSLLTHNDYRRLKLFLQRTQDLLSPQQLQTITDSLHSIRK